MCSEKNEGCYDDKFIAVAGGGYDNHPRLRPRR